MERSLLRQSLGALLIGAVLLGLGGCGGDKPAASHSKCDSPSGSALGSLGKGHTDLKSVLAVLHRTDSVPKAIRPQWAQLAAGYQSLYDQVGNINLSPPPTDPTVVAAIQKMMLDQDFYQALTAIERYCGSNTSVTATTSG
jgi:hypothetical protein